MLKSLRARFLKKKTHILQANAARSECQAVWDGSLGLAQMTASLIQVLVGVPGFGVKISFNLAVIKDHLYVKKGIGG